ncbi:Dabb family protein [Cupriavidus sp. D39]|uniref:Dabb family protein n=1 Tax=Cupriavidus sp. D39 TaxID=2997877 RepID=UPI002D1E364A|nr:Dabb family protein [Cupriavidus sp. D39]
MVTARRSESPSVAAQSVFRHIVLEISFRSRKDQHQRGRDPKYSWKERLKMIKHIVMWNLRGTTPDEKADSVRRVRAAFDGLQALIPGLTALEIGVDVSGIDYACDVVLYSEFESREALDSYAIHPEHLRVKRELADLRITRYQVDYLAE